METYLGTEYSWLDSREFHSRSTEAFKDGDDALARRCILGAVSEEITDRTCSS